MKSDKQDWEKRWKITKEYQGWNLSMMDGKEIKSFIQSELDRQLDEILEMVDCVPCSWDPVTREEIFKSINLLESKIKSLKSK